jgi:AcrR family transcriptional regulator
LRPVNTVAYGQWMAARLGRDDWLAAARAALAESGVDAVRVEPLAQRLGITKGSFYWHFRDRPALLAALLEEWEKLATLAIIDEVEAGGGDASARLLRLFLLTLDADPRLERQLRAWAAGDPAAAAIVERVDRRRLRYLRGLFAKLGFSSPEARTRAHLVYYSALGEITLGIRASRAARLRAARLIHAMVVRR